VCVYVTRMHVHTHTIYMYVGMYIRMYTYVCIDV